VPGRAFWLARRVLDLAHLVQVAEGVEQAQVDSGKGAPHREALTHVTVGSCRDRDHSALDRRRVWLRDSWEAEDVVARDSRHAVVRTRGVALRNVSVRAGPGRRLVR